MGFVSAVLMVTLPIIVFIVALVLLYLRLRRLLSERYWLVAVSPRPYAWKMSRRIPPAPAPDPT